MSGLRKIDKLATPKQAPYEYVHKSDLRSLLRVLKAADNLGRAMDKHIIDAMPLPYDKLDALDRAVAAFRKGEKKR